MSEEQNKLNSDVTNQAIRMIVYAPRSVGGDVTDTLAILESVIIGVFLNVVRPHGDDMVLDELVKHVKERLPRYRLKATKAEGNA